MVEGDGYELLRRSREFEKEEVVLAGGMVDVIAELTRSQVPRGMVRLVDGDPEARQLCRGGWVDGSAHARLDELPGRYTRFTRWMVALLLAFLAFAVLLSVTS